MTGSGPVDAVEHRSWTLRGHGDMDLRLQSWTPLEGDVIGRLVVVHGLGDHAGRYEELGRRGAARGIAVLSYDQRGHGLSGGRRGVVDRFEDYLLDLEAVLGESRTALPGEGEPALLGHSMGGLVVLRFLQTRNMGVPGTVLSAPWLATAARIPAWKRWAARILLRVAPGLTLAAGVDATDLTRDPVRQREHREDPLVHDRVSAGLHREVLEAQERALADPLPHRIPLLLLVPLDDPLVDAAVTREHARNPEGPVHVELLEGGRHEPLNDVDRERVLATVLDWLAGVLPGEPRGGDRVS